MKAPFLPTSCTCVSDKNNCQRQPGHLVPGQMQEILTHLGKTLADAGQYFWNSPGMVLGSSTSPGYTWRLRTITPQFINGRCVFYTDEGRCSIHKVAPFGCRYFDVHMTTHKAQKRAKWGMNQILDSINSYGRERDSLPVATHYQPRGFTK